MATACWAFIVAKRPLLKTAPLLDFSSLQAANSNFYPQEIHKALWAAWGYFHATWTAAAGCRKHASKQANSMRAADAIQQTLK
jgi:hypothetical protein